MSTIRELLQVILEEEIAHQQTRAALANLQKQFDAQKAEHDKCLARRKKREARNAPSQS